MQSEETDDESSNPESSGNGCRYTKGNAAFHDKTSAGTGIDGTGSSTGHITAYRCPFCDFSDTSEEVVRGHITTEDDSRHRNRNGYLDQIYVHGVDENGEVIEDRESPGQTPTTHGTDETTLIPDGVDEDSIEADILRAAITSPGLSYAELARRACGEDISVSGGRVKRVIKKHLGAVDAGEKSHDPRMEKSGFYDATEKQRRVILSWIADPDEDRSSRDISQDASTSPRYPDQVLDRYDQTIDHLRAKLDVGSMSFDTLIKRADLDHPEKLTLPAGVVSSDVADEVGVSIKGTHQSNSGGELTEKDRVEIIKDAVREYLDLTPKMQSVLLAELAEPTRTATERDEIAGVSMGYGSRVMEKHRDLLDTLAWGVCNDEPNFDPLDLYKVSVLDTSPDELDDDIDPEDFPDHSLEELDLSGDTTRSEYPIDRVDIVSRYVSKAESDTDEDEVLDSEHEDEPAENVEPEPEPEPTPTDSAAATGYWVSEKEARQFDITVNALIESTRNEKESAEPGTPMAYAADRQLHILELAREFAASHRKPSEVGSDDMD